VLLEDGKNILLADTPQEIADAVLKLMSDQALCKQLGDEAHKQAKEHYDWQILGDKLLKVYTSLLGSQ
jgi:glycosyltransferase involved in cell wall biosynthesis